jgi:nitroreductase
MDAIEALTTRASALKLTEPAPPDDAVELMLSAAARAPDHGKLRPWRFILIRGDARRRLGDVMATRLAAREPECPESAIENERSKPLRAPLIVVVATELAPNHPKIPEVEQLVSAACAAQNLMLAAHAMGYGAMWKTGAAAYDDRVKRELRLETHDHIVGFLYLGTMEMADQGKIERPHFSTFVRHWSGAET